MNNVLYVYDYVYKTIVYECEIKNALLSLMLHNMKKKVVMKPLVK